MAKNFVSNSPESVRMFKSGALEIFSKVPYYVPLIIFVPAIGFFTWKALSVAGMEWWRFLMLFAIGIAVWTFVEYIVHRWVFHTELKGRIGERIHFVFHGVHHDYPNDKLRLVLPPSVSIPLAFIWYGIFLLIMPKEYVWGLFPGFVVGYLIYDLTHYAIHHFNFKGGWWKKVKQHHMLHHYSDASKGYGVSSKVWDHIFSSDFPKKQTEEGPRNAHAQPAQRPADNATS